MSSRAAVLVLSACLSLTLPRAASAAWLPNGNPIATVTGDQDWPRLAPDDRGGAFVVWSQGAGARAQRFEADGDLAPGWPTAGLAVPPYPSPEPPAAHPFAWPGPPVPDGEGGVYVVTSAGAPCTGPCGGEPVQLFMERLGPSGALAPGWTAQGGQVEQDWLYRYTLFVGSTQVAGGREGVLVLWLVTDTRLGVPVNQRLMAQSIAPDGTLRWGANGLEVASGVGIQPTLALVDDGDGGALAFWAEQLADSTVRLLTQHVSLRARLLLGAGGARVTDRRMTELHGLLAVPDGRHGAIVTWQGGEPGRLDLLAARVPADARRGHGHGAGNDVVLCSGPGERSAVQIVPDDGGGALVAWLDSRSAPDLHVYAQRLTAEGGIAWGPAGAPACTAPGVMGGLALASDGHGGAFLAWSDAREEGRLYATRLTGHGERAPGWPADGALVSSWPAGVTNSESRVLDLYMTATRSGHAIVTWESWQFAPPPGIHIQVYQSFAMLLGPSGPAVSPGDTLGPRSPRELPDASAPAPERGRAAFALHAVQPNPASTGAGVRFALPDAAPAALEMFDVAGRRVWTREVGALGAGEHDVRLRDGAWSPPGLYLVRLTQGERMATTRVAIVH